MSHLLDWGRYDKRVPPYDPINHTVVVGVIYNLHTIIKIDEVQETMTTAGYLRVMWQDTGLSWDSQSYNGIRNIYLSQNSIWKPDLVLANGIEKAYELGTDMGLVMVNDNGDVTWLPFEVFTTKCMIDMTYYPFDTQSCDDFQNRDFKHVHQKLVDDFRQSGQRDTWDVILSSKLVLSI